MHKLSAHRATIYWVLVVLIFFIPYVSGCGGSGVSNDGVSIGSSGETGAIQDSSREYKTQKALPQNTLAFIEEEGKRYKEYLEKVKNDPNYPGSILDPTKFTQKQIQATPKDTYDPDKYLCFPEGSIYYGLNEIPYMTSSVPFSVPLMFLATQADNGDRKELPLSGISAKKAHFIVFAGCSTDVPDRHVGTITMSYADGTTNQLELTMGTNIAEWAYDRPELQGHILHSKVPSGYDRTTSQDSNYEYTAHFYYVSIDLQPTELTSMALSMDSDMHQQGDGYFDLIIMSMTLEIVSDLSIENAKATPEEFTPSKKGENNTTNITAQIVANSFQADSIQWQVTVENESGTVVKTFKTKTGSPGAGPWDVNETWDGKISKKEFVPYGTYKFKIKATATNSTKTVDAEATGIVKVEEPLPKLVKIEFQDSLNLQTDEGEKIKPIYYEQKGDEIIENPVAVTTENFMEPAMAMRLLSEKSQLQIVGGKARMGRYEWKPTKLVFERPEGLTDNTTVYEFELKDYNGQIIRSIPSDLSFSSGGKKEEVFVVLIYENKITRIYGLNVDLRRKGTTEWHTIARPTKTIYSGLGEYKEPFIKGSDKKGPTLGLQDIAHYLGEGATTEQEAREIMLRRLCLGENNQLSWLNQKRFIYSANPPSSFFRLKNGKVGDNGENNPKGGIFHYAAFMVGFDDENIEWTGDCQDISAFYVLCSSTVGVEMNLSRIAGIWDSQLKVRSPFLTQQAKFSGFLVKKTPSSYSSPIFKCWDFPMHQVAELSGQIWDPMFIFGSETSPILASNISRGDYYNLLVEEQPALPKPSAIHRPMFRLEKVILPAWASEL
ncbi:MAG: FlgD immunoglobulin-like domain containing protein [Vulcanimicrobiota bacterium]